MMYHPLSSAMAQALSKPHVELAYAAYVEAPSGDVRVHSGIGELVINSQLFSGLGTLGSISPQKMDGGTEAKQLNLSLSLIDSAMVAMALNESVVGSYTEIYLVAMNQDGSIDEAQVFFAGKISSVSAVIGDENQVTYSCANELDEWDKTPADRYTDDSHQQRYPGDRFYRYTAQMSERTITWGSKTDAPAFIYGD